MGQSCRVWGLVAISIREAQPCRGIEMEVVGGAGRSSLNAAGIVSLFRNYLALGVGGDSVQD